MYYFYSKLYIIINNIYILDGFYIYKISCQIIFLIYFTFVINN